MDNNTPLLLGLTPYQSHSRYGSRSGLGSPASDSTHAFEVLPMGDFEKLQLFIPREAFTLIDTYVRSKHMYMKLGQDIVAEADQEETERLIFDLESMIWLLTQHTSISEDLQHANYIEVNASLSVWAEMLRGLGEALLDMPPVLRGADAYNMHEAIETRLRQYSEKLDETMTAEAARIANSANFDRESHLATLEQTRKMFDADRAAAGKLFVLWQQKQQAKSDILERLQVIVDDPSAKNID
jgi:hypothetical protein